MPFRVVPPCGVDERPLAGESPESLVRRLARLKAQTVARRYSRHPVLAADTVVVSGGRILGKPQDRCEAGRMIRALSGRTHRVLTGTCLMAPQGKAVASCVTCTKVRFRDVGSGEIARYLATGEAADKAGAYAIQGTALRWVAGLRGDYFNVVGLPIGWVAERMSRRPFRSS